MLVLMTIRILSPMEVAALRARALPVKAIRLITLPPRAPAGPDPTCELLEDGHELADAVIDAEPGLRDIERFTLRFGVALLHAWLKPASCPGPI
jgi:hypothetical protein